MDKILVISPHADDEVLGCSCVINDRSILLLCAYEESKPEPQGFHAIKRLNLKDGRFEEHNFGDIVKGISDVLQELKPDTIFIPYKFDIHSDHRIIHDASISAAKIFRASFVKEIYECEIMSQTNLSSVPFNPDTYFKIDIEKKKKLLKLYKDCSSDCGRGEREIEALAVYRGTQSGLPYAEAFKTIRRIC